MYLETKIKKTTPQLQDLPWSKDILCWTVTGPLQFRVSTYQQRTTQTINGIYIIEKLQMRWWKGPSHRHLWCSTVDGSEIRRSPVEVGSLSHHLQGFKNIPGGCLGLFSINSRIHGFVKQLSACTKEVVQPVLTHTRIRYTLDKVKIVGPKPYLGMCYGKSPCIVQFSAMHQLSLFVSWLVRRILSGCRFQTIQKFHPKGMHLPQSKGENQTVWSCHLTWRVTWFLNVLT